MDREPITLPKPTRERVVTTPSPGPPPAALDEAFASAGESGFRLDGSHLVADEATIEAPTAGLANELRDQLRALDAQRSQLARLLDGLGG